MTVMHIIDIVCVIVIACIAVYSTALWYRERVDAAVIAERRRVSAYLRNQAHMAEVVSHCTYLSELGREQEAYASAVLTETAFEVDTCAHHAEVEK